MRYLCPPTTKDAYRWQLLQISKGDSSVEDYTREFLILSHHATYMIGDKCRAVDLFMTRLGPTYVLKVTL